MHKRWKSDKAVLGLMCVIASGCAAGISNQPVHGRAAGEWSVTLPTAASYSQGLAYGKGGSPLPDTWVDLDSVVQPMLAEARPRKLSNDEPKKKPVHKPRNAEPRPVSNEPEPEQAPVPGAGRYERTEIALADTTQPMQTQYQADVSMLNRYEERQSQSQEQQKFRGGDAIIIGASTLVIVLLIVLLVVLLL